MGGRADDALEDDRPCAHTTWMDAPDAGGLGSLAFGQERARAYDVVIRGGKIVERDRQSLVRRRRRDPRRSDRRGRSSRGRVACPPGDRRRGLIVAAGLHRHALAFRHDALEDGDAQSKVRQGVTTEILGEDTSAGPSKGKAARAPWRTVTAARPGRPWAATSTRSKRAGIAVNVASYVGLGTLLGCVLGDSLDRPDARPARGDEGAPRRGDARRGDRALHHARRPARAGRHDRRPGRLWPGGQAPRRPVLVAHPQRGDRGVRRGQGGDRRRPTRRRPGRHHPPQDRRPVALGIG